VTIHIQPSNKTLEKLRWLKPHHKYKVPQFQETRTSRNLGEWAKALGKRQVSIGRVGESGRRCRESVNSNLGQEFWDQFGEDLNLGFLRSIWERQPSLFKLLAVFFFFNFLRHPCQPMPTRKPHQTLPINNSWINWIDTNVKSLGLSWQIKKFITKLAQM